MNNPIVVNLDDCELEIATAVAAFRVRRVMREGLGRGHGESGVGFEDRHLPGAIGELALAKALQLYWGGSMNDFGAFGDVGGYEVRGSFHPRAHCIVYQTDFEANPQVVLVTIAWPTCTIHGCIWAAEAIGKEEYKAIGERYSRKGSAKSFWVPQSDLHSL